MERFRVFWDRWWRTAVSFAAVAVFATMVWVSLIVLDERKYFEQEAARDRAQDEQVDGLLTDVDEVLQIARDDNASRDERLASAVSDVEALLVDYFSLHDENVAQKLNEMLRRIESLLGRPAGEPLDPVTAQPYHVPAPAAPVAPGAASSPEPRPAPTSPPPTTTPPPTTPDQRRCATEPDHPRC